MMIPRRIYMTCSVLNRGITRASVQHADALGGAHEPLRMQPPRPNRVLNSRLRRGTIAPGDSIVSRLLGKLESL